MTLTIEKLAEELKAWKGCELAKNANPVLGEGNPKSKVVFIGEAPGQKEDEQGRPFVGAAGKFLDELLKSIGFNREDVYITNIVKYIHLNLIRHCTIINNIITHLSTTIINIRG